MKINKKIEIERHKMGAAFLDEKNELDSIEISMDIFNDTISQWYSLMQDVGAEFNFMPFLQNGYIFFRDTDSVLYFSCSLENTNTIVIEFIKYLYCSVQDTVRICGEEYSSIEWSYFLKIEIPEDVFFGTSMPTDIAYVSENCEISSAAILEAMDRNISPDADIIDAKYKEELKYSHIDIYIFFVSMAYINYLFEHPEFKELDSKVRNTAKRKEDVIKNKKVSATSTPKPPKIIESNVLLNGIKFVIRNKKMQTILKSKKPRKYAGSWYVSGHYILFSPFVFVCLSFFAYRFAILHHNSWSNLLQGSLLNTPSLTLSPFTAYSLAASYSSCSLRCTQTR